MANMAFGNSCYAHEMSGYPGIGYQNTSLTESITRTDGDVRKNVSLKGNYTQAKKSKALILASVASMIDQFNMHNIQLLLDNGYDIDVVCNCKEGNTISDERIQAMIEKLSNSGVIVYHVPIPRKISNVKGIGDSIAQVRKMCEKNHYKLLHCHSPIGSIVARIAAKGKVDKVIYTAHGFHFYKGAPKKNWFFFFPIEELYSYFTDVLITINREDYEFAKKHMHAKKVEYIPGIGVDTKKFRIEDFDRDKKRGEIGLIKEDIMIISVGELNENKNQEVVVKAIAKLKNDNIHYFIAGKGDKKDYLERLAKDLGINLHLLGYRTDIVELLNASDIYVFPSRREGLSVALMEAMAAGLPCVVSNIRGNVDLIEDGQGGYLCDPLNVEEFSDCIDALIQDNAMRKEMININLEKIKTFDMKYVFEKMDNIYFDNRS